MATPLPLILRSGCTDSRFPNWSYLDGYRRRQMTPHGGSPETFFNLLATVGLLGRFAQSI